TSKGHDVETQWLAKGIGEVKSDDEAKIATTANGKTTTSTTTDAFTLTESSLVPAPAAALNHGVLTISGTAAADSISITRDGDKLVVTSGIMIQGFKAASVSSILVAAGDGKDVIAIGPLVGAVYVDAGPGDDRITGGDFNDTL